MSLSAHAILIFQLVLGQTVAFKMGLMKVGEGCIFLNGRKLLT